MKPLPDSDVPVVDAQTGLMTRDWYDYFLILDRAKPVAIQLKYGTTIQTDASSGDVFFIDFTDGTSFTIAAPKNGIPGQIITYVIRNFSGGAPGGISWETPAFRTAFGTLPNDGFSRSVEFVYDGSNWTETFRAPSPGDVPNE